MWESHVATGAEDGSGRRVFMMDLLATVPYYTAYLSQALLGAGVALSVGSITYYLDRGCFSTRGVALNPGCVDWVGKLSLARGPRRLSKLAETVANMLALAARFVVRPPAVVHVQYLPMLRSLLPLDWWFVLFCRWRGARIVLTVHDLLPHDTADTYHRLFHRVYAKVDAIICHSAYIRDRLKAEFNVSGTKVWVIPHGPFFYDLPEGDAGAVLRGLALPPGARLVLWQGILFPYKGLDILINAWQRVEAEAPDACLLVVGTGSPELVAQAQEQVRRLGLRRVTLLLRFVSAEELVAIYRASEVVVYPYRAISTSGALATGLALGKAIVASDLPVFRELLTNRHDALLVRPTDVEALAHALMELLQDADLQARLVSAVRAKGFGRASWMGIATETRDVYDAVLAQVRREDRVEV